MIKKPNIILVGLGGTGSIVRDEIGTLFSRNGDFKDRHNRIILVDADAIEASNITRQNYIKKDMYKNKAVISAEILQKNYEVPSVEAYPTYLTVKLLTTLLQSFHKENFIIISCVDNHQSRNRIYQCLKPNIEDTKSSHTFSFRKRNSHPSFLFMDCGNDTHSGWTSALLWDNKRFQGTDMRLRDTALRLNNSQDAPVVGGTCARNSNPQTRYANARNASLVSSQLVSYLKYGRMFGCIGWEDSDFSTDSWADNQPMSYRIDPIITVL